MLKNLKLSYKLNLLLLVILIALITTSGWVLSVVLNKNAERIVVEQASLLIETMSSVRDYTNRQVRPELVDELEDPESQFLPQTIPAYSAREVFEGLRNRNDYDDFFYKEATLNPTNPRDKADNFEARIVNNFRSKPNISELKGFRELPSGDIFYIARPLAVTQESCLDCHSTPENAPRSQINTYGDENGFGWKLNEIVGAQIISVPASKVFGSAQQLKFVVIGVISAFLVLAVVLLNIFLRLTITNPLMSMAGLSKRVSTGDMSVEFEQDSNDEIGILAASLNRLKVSLQMAMDMLENNQENQQ